MTAPGSAPTLLAEKLARRIRVDGPMTVADFMAACLGDPEHGYYLNREPFGRAGDFITAPEISQMFGELIGLWAVAVWEAMGSPTHLVLAELGPGRGTLMADALRAARVRPAFLAAAQIHLVETSPRLREAQAAMLTATATAPQWHAGIDDLPPGPAIILANEFFDALPIRQFVSTGRGWAERMVGLDGDGRLAFGLRPGATPPALPVGDPPPGAVVADSPAADATIAVLAARLVAQGGAALAIDYGYAGPTFGDTLQAVRRHRFDDPLAHPGEADLTAHVDFAALARTAAIAGAAVHGPIGQGAFLAALGIAERARRLAAGKDAATRSEVAAALHRLTHVDAMGELFKAMAVAAPGLSLPAFDSVPAEAEHPAP